MLVELPARGWHENAAKKPWEGGERAEAERAADTKARREEKGLERRGAREKR